MRLIGTVKDAAHAERFVDFLVTQQIPAKADLVYQPTAKGSSAEKVPVASSATSQQFEIHEIWIQDEDAVSRARDALNAFNENPDAPQYLSASKDAARIRKEQRERAAQVASLHRKLPQSSLPTGGPGGGQRLGRITVLLAGLAILVTLLTNFSQQTREVTIEDGQLTVQDTNQLSSLFKFVDLDKYAATDPPDPLASIKEGQVWRFFTPALMHGSVAHLVFNILSLISLGSLCEHLFGKSIYIWLLIASHIVGTLCQALIPGALGGNPNFVGLSGVVYGVFGFLWVRPAIQTGLPPLLPSSSVMLMLGWMLLGWLPIPGLMMANWAHLGGLLGGIACAFALPRTRGIT